MMAELLWFNGISCLRHHNSSETVGENTSPWNCSSWPAGCRQGAASGKDLLPRGLWHQKLLCQGSGWRNTEVQHMGMVKVSVCDTNFKRKIFLSVGDISALSTSRDHPWAMGVEAAGANRQIHPFPEKTEIVLPILSSDVYRTLWTHCFSWWRMKKMQTMLGWNKDKSLKATQTC